MDREYQSLLENNTWKLEKLPSERKVVHCQWVFKIKYNSDGTIYKFKARLVAKELIIMRLIAE